MWGDSHWSGRPAYAQELVNGTTFALQQLTLLAAEGHSTPQVTVLVGLDNGGVAPIPALNEEIAWIRQNYLSQWPQHFTMLDGLPLLVVFDGSGERGAVQAEGFTLRWMASQMQAHCLPNVPCVMEDYWSWMDGSASPYPAVRNGTTEAVTVTPAFFGLGGWLGKQTRGREGGSTWADEVATVLAHPPEFLIVCQFNEYAGQPVSAAAPFASSCEPQRSGFTEWRRRLHRLL